MFASPLKFDFSALDSTDNAADFQRTIYDFLLKLASRLDLGLTPESLQYVQNPSTLDSAHLGSFTLNADGFDFLVRNSGEHSGLVLHYGHANQVESIRMRIPLSWFQHPRWQYWLFARLSRMKAGKPVKTVRFKDLNIGNIFKALGTYWVRIDFEVAACLEPGKYGTYSFSDKKVAERIVQYVNPVEVASALKSARL